MLHTTEGGLKWCLLILRFLVVPLVDLVSDSERMDDAGIKKDIYIYLHTPCMYACLYIQLGRTHGKAKHYKYPRYH